MKFQASLGERLVQIGLAVAVVLGWYYVTSQGMISHLFLPPLDGVLGHFVRIVSTGEALGDLQMTMYELVLAFAMAVSAGLGVGYVVGSSRFLTSVLEPLLTGFFAIPIIIFFPLFILYFGLGPASKIAFGAVFGFFPVVLNTISGFGNLDPRLVDVARSMGASNFQMFRRVLFPGALPVILTGLRMGLILTFLAIIGGEMLSSLQGVGYKIVWLAELMETARMFAYIAFVIIIAGALNVLASLMGSRDRGA